MFKRRFTVLNQEDSAKSGWLEIKCYLSALGLADDVNILGEKVHNIKKKTEALVIVTKKIGLEVNADKIKYMTMPLYQN